MPEGETLVARFKNGEIFEGVSLGYFDRSSARFEIVSNGKTIPVTPRLGDNPALDVPAPGAGLAVVVHETTPSFVTYKSWEKFDKFARHKAFGDWRSQHDSLGYSAPPFKERYTRHAKALIAVDDGSGQDIWTGLVTEFVALTNPYAANFDNVMRVSVHYGEFLRKNAQVEVFDRAPDGQVTVTLYRTNDKGIAAVPVTPGHDYLFDAVVLEPISPADPLVFEKATVWDTHWAALTFSVPAR